MTHAARPHSVAACGEYGLLRGFKRDFAATLPGVSIGIGDDAAVMADGTVLTTDTLVEDVDFRLRWATWSQIGRKAAAVNISDLAAMGAAPTALLLSLSLRGDDSATDTRALVRAVNREGMRFGAPLVGGDLSETTGPLVITVTAIGHVAPSKTLRRHRGRPGDLLAVTGSLGGASAGLRLLEEGSSSPRSLILRQLQPCPRIEVASAWAAVGCVRSAADISDGLAGDAAHILRQDTGVVIDAASLPILSSVRKVSEIKQWSTVDLALHGGEDFELVVAIKPQQLEQATAIAGSHGSKLTVVGKLTKRPGTWLLPAAGGPERRLQRAYAHFR